MSPEEVTLAFVKAINAADIEALGGLMAEAHTFTDALGNSFAGKAKMLQGWRFFFAAYPSYNIGLEQVCSRGTTVALMGKAGGGWRVDGDVLDKHWATPAAWWAEIEDGKVLHWKVFCDTAWATPPSE